MSITFWMISSLWFLLLLLVFSIGLVTFNQIQFIKNRDSLQDHIEYLEEYIKENNLPTPVRQL